ncbi:MAG TPA: IS66 family transposase [Tepidisphaeraceae bacterium]
MTEHSPTTPDDPAQLRAQLDAALTRIADLERLLDELAATTEERERTLDCLKEELLNLKRLLYGPRRERLPEAPGQGHLFDDENTPNPPPEPIDDSPDDHNPPKRRKGHGRRVIPDHLPRTDVPHDVPAADQMCACGRAKTKIGEDVTEQLDYVPGKLIVLRHIYPKYACSCCQDGVTTAPTAPAPIPGGLPAAGLLGYIVVNKFTTHIPLYRQQDDLARAGLFFPRSTLCDWVRRCSELFKPLVDLMHKEVLKSRIIQGDETPVPVLDPSRDSTRTGYIWTTIGDRGHPYTTCHYTDSRSRDGPAEFLAGFQGFLQTDAYSSYESIVLKSAGKIIAVGCWAHARRDFFDARLNYPREAHYVLGLIAQLYDIEDEIAGRSDVERLAERQARSVPVLARLEKFLREQKETALPQSKFGQAIGYALNHWEELLRYTTDGALEIDNNRSERTLRPVAIGRKNWMFFGSDRGGETAALCMSILSSAKRHGIEPMAYVTALLTALSSEGVDLKSLLPDVWIAAHPEHFQKDRRDEAKEAARRRRQRRADRRAKARLEAQAQASSPLDR